MLTREGVPYTYDNNGNTLSWTNGSGTTSYTWDFENRLTSLTIPAGTVVNYEYDPFGRRIETSSSAATTVYVYDGNNIEEELNGTAHTLGERFTYGRGIDEPLVGQRQPQTYYYGADGLDSVTSLTDPTGALAATYTYDSFGDTTNSTGSATNWFRYTGREFDSTGGLYYYRARYYNPEMGRFLSEDRLRFNAGLNFYPYVRSNPTNLIDPTGMAPCLNINAFVNELNSNAGDTSTGQCAQYVRWALQAGGIDTSGHPSAASDYGPFLQGQGFSDVSTDNYTPQIEDIAVFQPYPGGDPNGHIQGWNGTSWVSDFTQPYPPNAPGGIYPGPGYRNAQSDYSIYRPTPCPTSIPPPTPPEQGLIQRLLTWLGHLW